MPPRHSCDRCRQQKVRCLRDDRELHSLSQSLSPCQRCANANVPCVYSLRCKTRPSTASNASTREDSTMTAFETGLVDTFSSEKTLSAQFNNLSDSFPPLGDGADHGFSTWDPNPPMFSQTSPLALTTPFPDVLRDRDLGFMSSDEENDSIDSFIWQLTALAQRAMRAVRSLAQSPATLTVSSAQVNQALEDTNTLIRIVNEFTTTVEADDGLVFLALASHHRLVELFKAICDSIHRDLESAASNKEQQRSDLRGGAQLVMILQLLMHLVNRIDQNLFQNRRGSDSSGPVTPITSTSHMDPLLIEDDGIIYSRGLQFLAGGIVQTIPNQHVQLKHIIQELQMRIEQSNFL